MLANRVICKELHDKVFSYGMCSLFVLFYFELKLTFFALRQEKRIKSLHQNIKKKKKISNHNKKHLLDPSLNQVTRHVKKERQQISSQLSP